MGEETYCIQGASGLLICLLVWAIGFVQKRLDLPYNELLADFELAGMATIGRNLCGARADCCFSGSVVIWMSLQNEGRIP